MYPGPLSGKRENYTDARIDKYWTRVDGVANQFPLSLVGPKIIIGKCRADGPALDAHVAQISTSEVARTKTKQLFNIL